MEQLEDGGLAIDSAFEAEVLGRTVARGANDGSTQYYFRHPGYEYPARNESEFFDREVQAGRLALNARLAGLAEKGIDAIISTDASFNGISPSMAQVFRTALDRSRAHRVLSEVPAPGDTHVVVQKRADAEVIAA